MSDGISIAAETPDRVAIAIQAVSGAALDLIAQAREVKTVRDALALHAEIEQSLKVLEYASGLAIDKADELLKGQS